MRRTQQETLNVSKFSAALNEADARKGVPLFRIHAGTANCFAFWRHGAPNRAPTLEACGPSAYEEESGWPQGSSPSAHAANQP